MLFGSVSVSANVSSYVYVLCTHECAMQYQKLPGIQTIDTIDLGFIHVSFPRRKRKTGHNTTETNLYDTEEKVNKQYGD